MNEKKRDSEAKPLGDLVEKLMKAYQLDERLAEIEVLNQWETLMGKGVSLRTKNLFIRDKVLILEMDSSVARDEIFYMKNIIIQRVNDAAGKEIIEDVYFK